jgi:hypothetical protein
VTCVAFFAATMSTAEAPLEIEAGLTVMLIVGSVGGTTVTVAFADIWPPAPDAVAV